MHDFIDGYCVNCGCPDPKTGHVLVIPLKLIQTITIINPRSIGPNEQISFRPSMRDGEFVAGDFHGHLGRDNVVRIIGQG